MAFAPNRNLQFYFNASFLAFVLSVIFSAFTYKDFNKIIFRISNISHANQNEININFFIPLADKDILFNIETSINRDEDRSILLQYFINNKPIGNTTVKGKSWYMEFSGNFLVEGQNSLQIKSNQNWNFDKIRIQNIYGHSSGLFAYVVIHKSSKVSDHLIVSSPNDLFLSILFFIGNLGLFWIISIFNSKIDPNNNSISGWIGIHIKYAFFFLIIVILPILSKYKILLSYKTLLIIILLINLCLIKKKTWTYLLKFVFSYIIKTNISVEKFFKYLTPYYQKSKKILFPAILLLTTLAVYLNTLLPGLGYSGDTAKFQFIGKIMGTPHATGYPLYIILNKLFILLPIHTIAYRANLMSTFFGILTVLLLYFTIRMIVENEWISLCSSLLFAFTVTFWSQALVAEVYALNVFFVILVFYLLIKWHHNQSETFFYLFLFFYAISFGNHMTMITVFPAILFYVITVDFKIIFKLKSIIIALISILIGAGQYFLLYFNTIQNSPYLEQRIYTFKGFLDVVTGKQFQKNMFDFSFVEVLFKRIPMYYEFQKSEISIYLLIFGLIGIVFLFKKSKQISFLIFFGFIGESIFLLNYDIADIAIFYIPIYLFVSIFIGIGLNQVFVKLRMQLFQFIFIVAILIGISQAAILNYNKVDLSKDIYADNKLTSLFKNIENHSVIATDNYLDKMYVYNKMFLQSPEKKLYHFEIDSKNDIRLQITHNLLRVFNIESILRNKKVRHMYLISEDTNKAFNSQGIKTIPIILLGKLGKNNKKFVFFKVILDVHHFH